MRVLSMLASAFTGLPERRLARRRLNAGRVIAQSVPFAFAVWGGGANPLRNYDWSQSHTLTTYDASGNMRTSQVGGQYFTLDYDPENRMTVVTGAATANFTYNGDGARVIAVEGRATTVYIGSCFG